MCPRKLEPFTLYSAFVVPSYNSGRHAGLGRQVECNDALAWNNETDESIELPVYYRWDFQTSETGDFEKLIDLLNFREIPEGVGTKLIDGSKPGFLYDKDGGEITFNEPPDNEIKVEGALVAPGHMKARDRIYPKGFAKAIITELNTSLEEAPVKDKADNDPLISIPVYGRYFQKPKKFKAPNSRVWIHELNLDRRSRVSTSLA